MKRFAAILGLLVLSSASAFAIQDRFGSERPAVWRTSYSASAENFVQIATGPCHLHSISIGSPTVNNDSYIALYNSTSTNKSDPTVCSSTAIYLITAVNTTISGSQPQNYDYDVYFSSGLVINKVGSGGSNAVTNIIWDFSNPTLKDSEWQNNRRSITPWTP